MALWTFEQIATHRKVALPGNLLTTIGAGGDISKFAVRTDSGQDRSCNVSAIGALGPRTFRHDRHTSPSRIPESVDDSLHLIWAICSELKVRVAIRIPVCPMTWTVGVNLDGRVCPQITSHSRSHTQVVGRIVRVVPDGDSKFLHRTPPLEWSSPPIIGTESAVRQMTV